MRCDMAKVIVERPRFGGGTKYPRGSVRYTDRLGIEDWHKRESIGRRWQGHSAQKFLNENLAPLRRFLRSKVGKPWNKVYAEICERIDRGSAVQLHIWQHLSDYVCANPYGVTGDVGRRFHGRLWHEFYVDPRTGLLRQTSRLTKKQWAQIPKRGPHSQQPPPLNPVLPINDNRCYEQIDGVWYELDLRKPPASGYVYEARTLCEVKFEPRGGFREYRGRRLYVGAKRRLDKTEAKRVGRAFRKQFEQDLRRSV